MIFYTVYKNTPQPTIRDGPHLIFNWATWADVGQGLRYRFDMGLVWEAHQTGRCEAAGLSVV